MCKYRESQTIIKSSLSGKLNYTLKRISINFKFERTRLEAAASMLLARLHLTPAKDFWWLKISLSLQLSREPLAPCAHQNLNCTRLDLPLTVMSRLWGGMKGFNHHSMTGKKVKQESEGAVISTHRRSHFYRKAINILTVALESCGWRFGACIRFNLPT
jgi:hypothetical protein